MQEYGDPQQTAAPQPPKADSRAGRPSSGVVIAGVISTAVALWVFGQFLDLTRRLAQAEQNAAEALGRMEVAIERMEVAIEMSERQDAVLEGLRWSHNIGGNVVTDQLVIERAFLRVKGTVMDGRVDLRAQPAFRNQYVGKGRFDLSDSELTAALMELMKSLEEYLEPDYVLGRIRITISNWEIGTYEDGQIQLKE